MRMITCLIGDSVLTASAGSLDLSSADPTVAAASENDTVALMMAALIPHLVRNRSVCRMVTSLVGLKLCEEASEQLSQLCECKMSVGTATTWRARRATNTMSPNRYSNSGNAAHLSERNLSLPSR